MSFKHAYDTHFSHLNEPHIRSDHFPVSAPEADVPAGDAEAFVGEPIRPHVDLAIARYRQFLSEMHATVNAEEDLPAPGGRKFKGRTRENIDIALRVHAADDQSFAGYDIKREPKTADISGLTAGADRLEKELGDPEALTQKP